MSKWKWEGTVFVDTPLERRVVDKDEAQERLDVLSREMDEDDTKDHARITALEAELDMDHKKIAAYEDAITQLKTDCENMWPFYNQFGRGEKGIVKFRPAFLTEDVTDIQKMMGGF